MVLSLVSDMVHSILAVVARFSMVVSVSSASFSEMQPLIGLPVSVSSSLGHSILLIVRRSQMEMLPQRMFIARGVRPKCHLLEKKFFLNFNALKACPSSVSTRHDCKTAPPLFFLMQKACRINSTGIMHRRDVIARSMSVPLFRNLLKGLYSQGICI